MRTLPAGLAILTLSAAALVGCSAAPAASCGTRTSAPDSAASLVSVTGGLGVAPDVAVPTPFRVTTTDWRDSITGAGEALISDEQVVLLDVSVVSGSTGAFLTSTGYTADPAAAVPLAQWGGTLPGLVSALHCATEGSRVVVALAPSDISPNTAASLGLGAGDTAVAVVDVRRVYLPKADGVDRYSDAHGLPTVVRAPDGRPGIIVPDAAAPAAPVVQTLKEGDGAVVAPTDTVRIHYTGVVWSSRTVFQTTWDSAPASLPLAQTLPAFAQALAGRTVGSQVLVVLPPDQAYGARAQGGIPADSTLVFVVDILGIDAAP